jgi:hypothetical protein
MGQLEVDLTNKSICIFGPRGSGKSVFMRYIAMMWGSRAFVYDPVDDVPPSLPVKTYTPKDRYSVSEFSRVISAVNKSNEYNLIAIDEANRYCKSKPVPLPEIIAELNDMHRHKEYGLHGRLTMAYIARRPVQLNQDITEVADYLFIFRLTGKNDREYLESIACGLGDTVVKLPQYHYVAVMPDRSFKISKPVIMPELK